MKKFLVVLFTLLVLIDLFTSKSTHLRKHKENKYHFQPALGGFGSPKAADHLSETLLKEVKSQVLMTLKSQPNFKQLYNGHFKVHEYSEKVVSGMIYLVRFSSGKNTFEATIFKPLPYTKQPTELTSLTQIVEDL